MKLPKKYAGITPGDWVFRQGQSESDFIVMEPTGGTLAEPNHPLYADYHDLDPTIRKIGVEEAKKNGLLMSDAPRLAASVVELRDKMNRLANSCDIGAKDAPTKMRPIFSMLSEECRKALESTKEWES